MKKRLVKLALNFLSRNGYAEIRKDELEGEIRRGDELAKELSGQQSAYQHLLQAIAAEKALAGSKDEMIRDLKSQVDSFAVKVLGMGIYDRELLLSKISPPKATVPPRGPMLPHELVRNQTAEFIKNVENRKTQ